MSYALVLQRMPGVRLELTRAEAQGILSPGPRNLRGGTDGHWGARLSRFQRLSVPARVTPIPALTGGLRHNCGTTCPCRDLLRARSGLLGDDRLGGLVRFCGRPSTS